MAKAPVLRVGPELGLPADAITQSIALLAVRRAGKSNAAAVIAEEMHHAGLPWVAIDPKGDWWGLRSSADGTGPGLPIPIFGGLHGDMPLLPEAGHLIAELITDQNLTCVLDVSEFASRAAQMRFLTDLADRLFRLHGKHPQPRHVFLEEADDVIPQRVMGEMARCVGAWTKLVKQGGSRGLGITLISQRSAVVNKDALTQTETMIALRTTSPQDQKAILEWVKYHAVAQAVVESLSGLDDGEAWVISPHWLGRAGQPAIQRIRFRQRATFDSGATPTLARRRRPATIADIDLGALQERMSAVTEKAAQDDPAALRRRIAQLERIIKAAKLGDAGEVARLTAENRDLRDRLGAAEQREPERVEVPVLAAGDVAAVEQAITGMRDVAGSLEIALSRASHPVPVPARAPAARPERSRNIPETYVSPPAPQPPVASPGDGPALKAGARRMLSVLARQHPLQVTRAQLATLAGMKARGGAYGTYLSALRLNGYLEENGKLVGISPAGLAGTGTEDRQPVTLEELREQWRGVLKAGARAMLDDLLDCYPGTRTRAELAAAASMEPRGGAFGTYLSNLRTNGLIEESDDGIRAAEVFFLTAASTR